MPRNLWPQPRHINGLMQERRNSNANTQEFSCTNPSIYLFFSPFTCSDCSFLQDHPVVDKPDVLGWLHGAWPLSSQQVKDTCGQHGVLTILDEFAEMSQTRLLGLCVLLQNADDGVNYGLLVLKATLG